MMLDTEIEWTRPKLYPRQAEFVDSAARYTVVEASTKTGKTVACLVWLFEQALRGRPGDNFWWVAPIYQQAGIAYRRLKRWIVDIKPLAALAHDRKTEQAIEIAGRVIWFKGADKPDSLYGEDVHAAVIDEATRCKEDAWHAVRSTLTATRGPVKIIGNVRGRHNWAYTLARKAEAGARDMSYFKLTAYDAVDGGVIAASEVEDAKTTLPEDVFRELYLAEPTDDGGNPFGIQAIRSCIATGLSSNRPVSFGVDLARSVDWTVICGLDATGAVCLLEKWQAPWNDTLARLSDYIGDVPALVDSTGVGDPIVEALQKRRPRVEGFKFSSQSKQQLMEGLAAAIQQRTISIPDGWLVSELEQFEYEYTRNGVRYTAPAGLHDDGVCALALAVRHFTTPQAALDVRLVTSSGDDDLEDERHWR